MKYSNPIVLEEGEQVMHDARKHWFLILVELFSLTLAILLPIIIVLIISSLPVMVGSFSNKITIDHLVFFGSIWFLIIWIMSFAVITDYTLDVVKITNRRIIDIDQRGFFSRNIATIRLETIQDITINTHGILPTLLHFGDLSIQSAGEMNEFVIRGLRDPDKVKDIVIREQGKALSK